MDRGCFFEAIPYKWTTNPTEILCLKKDSSHKLHLFCSNEFENHCIFRGIESGFTYSDFTRFTSTTPDIESAAAVSKDYMEGTEFVAYNNEEGLLLLKETDNCFNIFKINPSFDETVYEIHNWTNNGFFGEETYILGINADGKYVWDRNSNFLIG